MKKTGVVRNFICLILVILMISVPVYAIDESEYDLPVTEGCHSIDAQVPMLSVSKDIKNLKSAFLYDYTTETLLYSVNPDEPLDPGSFVKIMTALIICERADLNDKVTVDGSLLEQLPDISYGVDLQPGEIISVRDLLYCILVESADDASVIAANHVSGSIDAFVDEMNHYAHDLGCTNTKFTNVHGIYDPSQVMSARDTARILTKAVKNEAFMEIFSAVHYSVPATNKSDVRELASNNLLMNDDVFTFYLDYRVDSGRAAVAESGERHLAVTAGLNGVDLISIVMGSVSDIAEDGHSVVTYGSFGETSALLNLGFQGHYSFQIFHENQVLKQFEVPNGDCYLTTGVRESVQALLPYGVEYDDLSYRYNDIDTQINAPIQAGEHITTVQVWYQNLCLAVTDLYAMHDVHVKEIVETEEVIDEPAKSSIPAAVFVVITIVGLLFVLLFGRAVIFRLIRKRKIRRSKQIRRRKR